MKLITFDGRLGKDAEIRQTSNGSQYLSFSVANVDYSGGKNKTEWFNVLSFDSFIIEKFTNILKKGRFVIITGKIDFEINVSGGKLYKNIYVTATNIDAPNVSSNKRMDEEKTLEDEVSVYSKENDKTNIQSEKQESISPNVPKNDVLKLSIDVTPPTPTPAVTTAPSSAQHSTSSSVSKNYYTENPTQYKNEDPFEKVEDYDDDELPF